MLSSVIISKLYSVFHVYYNITEKSLIPEGIWTHDFPHTKGK